MRKNLNIMKPQLVNKVRDSLGSLLHRGSTVLYFSTHYLKQ